MSRARPARGSNLPPSNTPRRGKDMPARGPRGGPSAHRHRVYETGKRYMELVPSVSRSSGLEKDGDALRDFKLQEEYRSFIQNKVDEYWKRFPLDAVLNEEERKQKEEVQGNILILFRKLREGILSTNRRDAFGIEVYETSLYLSVIFGATTQTTSTLSHLLPLYTHERKSATPSTPTHLCPGRSTTTYLIALLHALHTTYPSQHTFYEQLRTLPSDSLPQLSPVCVWIHDLARSLRRCEYARLERFTKLGEFERFAGHEEGVSDGTVTSAAGSAFPNLPVEALRTLVDAIRCQARMTTWRIVRTAYRELACPPPTASPGATDTSAWLVRSLTLRPLEEATSSDEKEMEERRLAEQWLIAHCQVGEVKSKEGVDGRWLLLRVPVK